MDKMVKKWLKKAKNTMITYAAILAAMVLVLVLLLVFKVKLLAIIGILTGFIVAMIIVTICGYFDEKPTETAVKAAAGGISYAFIYTTEGTINAWFALAMVYIVLAAMGYLIFWWMKNGSAVKELIAFTILDLLLMFLACGAAAAILDLTQSKFLIGLMLALPKMMFFVSVGFFIANMIWFKQELNALEGGE